ERNAKRRPQGTALLYEDRRYTHREVHELSNRWANWLASRGVAKGDVVSVLLENRPEALLIVAGVVKLGAIAAVINTKQRGRTLQHSLALAKARLHVVGEELWDAFAEVRDAIGAGSSEIVAWVREHDAAAPPATVLDAAAAL